MTEEMDVTAKNCPICSQQLPLSEFGVCRARKDGRNLYCKSCIRKKVTDSRRALKEYRSARKRYVSQPLSEQIERGNCEVRVDSFQGLLVSYAVAQQANAIVRGIRAISDYEYELQMALMNRHLYPAMETIFMAPSFDTTYVSSSIVREVARFGGDVSKLVHPRVAQALTERFARGA